MSLDFTNKLVVITGVGRAGQVGEALALGFAQRGATLALLDLDATQVADRASTLTSQGFKATGHAGNLADPIDTMRTVASVMEAHPNFDNAVHAVICAAGGFGMTNALDSGETAAWHKQFTINLETAYNATRSFLPAVRKARGAFVYFGTVAALPGGTGAGMAAYVAAKSGVLALMRAVAADERANGVRANAVAPTQVRTAANIADMGGDKDYVERESVADVVAFLASPLARNISGQAIKLA